MIKIDDFFCGSKMGLFGAKAGPGRHCITVLTTTCVCVSTVERTLWKVGESIREVKGKWKKSAHGGKGVEAARGLVKAGAVRVAKRP
jgi:hypothetical protein